MWCGERVQLRHYVSSFKTVSILTLDEKHRMKINAFMRKIFCDFIGLK